MAAIKPTIVQTSNHPVPKCCESWKESVLGGGSIGYDRERNGIMYGWTHDVTLLMFIVTRCLAVRLGFTF